MIKYVDVVLTEDGYFCAAPMCTVHEGDLVFLPDAMSGKNPKKVVAVATDRTDGDHIKQIEKYIGSPLPRITEKYTAFPVTWGENDVQE